MPRRVVRRLGRTLGRRGAILLCYGTVWALYGYAQITSPQPDQRGLQPILERVPLTVWGWLWVATGLTAVVSAWLPQGRDWVGFLALPAMVLPMALCNLAGGWLGASLAIRRGSAFVRLLFLLVVGLLILRFGWDVLRP